MLFFSLVMGCFGNMYEVGEIIEEKSVVAFPIQKSSSRSSEEQQKLRIIKKIKNTETGKASYLYYDRAHSDFTDLRKAFNFETLSIDTFRDYIATTEYSKSHFWNPTKELGVSICESSNICSYKKSLGTVDDQVVKDTFGGGGGSLDILKDSIYLRCSNEISGVKHLRVVKQENNAFLTQIGLIPLPYVHSDIIKMEIKSENKVIVYSDFDREENIEHPINSHANELKAYEISNITISESNELTYNSRLVKIKDTIRSNRYNYRNSSLNVKAIGDNLTVIAHYKGSYHDIVFEALLINSDTFEVLQEVTIEQKEDGESIGWGRHLRCEGSCDHILPTISVESINENKKFIVIGFIGKGDAAKISLLKLNKSDEEINLTKIANYHIGNLEDVENTYFGLSFRHRMQMESKLKDNILIIGTIHSNKYNDNLSSDSSQYSFNTKFLCINIKDYSTTTTSSTTTSTSTIPITGLDSTLSTILSTTSPDVMNGSTTATVTETVDQATGTTTQTHISTSNGNSTIAMTSTTDPETNISTVEVTTINSSSGTTTEHFTVSSEGTVYSSTGEPLSTTSFQNTTPSSNTEESNTSEGFCPCNDSYTSSTNPFIESSQSDQKLVYYAAGASVGFIATLIAGFLAGKKFSPSKKTVIEPIGNSSTDMYENPVFKKATIPNNNRPYLEPEQDYLETNPDFTYSDSRKNTVRQGNDEIEYSAVGEFGRRKLTIPKNDNRTYLAPQQPYQEITNPDNPYLNPKPIHLTANSNASYT